MDELSAQRVNRLKIWFRVFLTIAVIGLLLSLVLGATPGFLTIIGVIFAILIHLEIKKEAPPEERKEYSRRNRKALVLLGIFILTLLLLTGILSILYPSS